MAKQKLTIEVDVPKGFEAMGEYRIPKKGEWFMSASTDEPMNARGVFSGKRVILRKLPQFPSYPEFLGGAGMAMDASGAWYCYETKPSPGFRAWDTNDDMIAIDLKFYCGITFPDISLKQWKESWWPNPRYEEECNG